MAFSISLTQKELSDPEKIEALDKIMLEYQDCLVAELQKISEELGVCIGTASDILYLRSRSRWTPELEKELIRLHLSGTPPNIYEFGC